MKKCIVAILLIVVTTFSGCSNKKIHINPKSKNESNYKQVENGGKIDESSKEEIKLDILVSNRVLYDCVKSIDKGKHKVDYIFKRDKNKILVSHYYDIGYVPDLFIYDEFNFSKLNNSYISKIEDNKVGIINASRGVNQLSYYKNVNKYGKGKECLLWNNVDNYKVVLVNVKNAIVERDPKNRSYYEENFNEVLKSLEGYEKVFKQEGSKVKDWAFIVEGDYLDYIMAYTGLKTVSVGENKDKSIDLKKVIEEKYDKVKDKIVLIYYSDDFLEQNKDTILKYNVKCIKINKIDPDTRYENLLEYEKKVLYTIVNVCTKR